MEVGGEVIRIWVCIVWESITDTSVVFIIHILESKASFCLKIQMNLYTKQKQTHRHRKQTYGYQRGKAGGRIN